MKKHGLHLMTFIYSFSFILLLITFFGIQIFCKTSSKKLHTYQFTSQNINVPQDGLVLTVNISKSWDDNALHPNIPFGAQYDGKLVNNSKYIFKDWTAKMTFSDNLYIDSSWNGIFSSDKNVLSFIAQDVPATVQRDSFTTFGAVMYAKGAMSLQEYSLTGYRIITPKDLVTFKILIIASILWIITLIIYILLEERTKKFRRQQELDYKIITQSMNTFTSFIDAKDTYTKGHSIRVAEYASEISRRMKLNSEIVKQMYYISLMHDCGKIGIPDTVLQKPGKLTDEEYKLVQSHTVIGDNILVNFTAIPEIRDGAHYHHERYDGKGYPTGVAGTDIPLCARIICVADSFDAMNSSRCYRKVLELSYIKNELKNNSGKQFDPEIVPYMIAMIEDGFVDKVVEKYPSIVQ